MQRKLTDVHAHLEQYSPEELESVLRRSRDAGVGWILTSGLDIETSLKGIEIARLHEGVLAAAGVHPWRASEISFGDFSDQLDELLAEEVTVAVGEVGLDFVDNVFTGTAYRDNPELRNAQEEALRRQIAAACSAGLPLIVHCRGAYPRLISILEEEHAGRVGGIVHNFDESEAAARRLLDLGFMLSLGGAASYPEAKTLHDLVRRLPLDGILLETDSPYMPLYRQPAEKNEPANVVEVARVIARIREVDPHKLIEATHRNFKTLVKTGD